MKHLPLLTLTFFSLTAHAYAPWNLDKEGCRRSIVGMSADNKFFSPILRNDRAQDLVDEPEKLIKSMKEMDKRQLREAQTLKQPWSDSYWPLFRGALGQRYADVKFAHFDWKGGRDYVTTNKMSDVIAQGQVDILSPAEKYDHLFGLDAQNLTDANWAEGQEYFDAYGTVETWMGMCHGWAAASIVMDEPVKKVMVQTASGPMTLFPSDIKGLTTSLWARGNYSTKFIGGRCHSKDPGRDRRGRPSDEDCLDTNPGTWHLAVVNQIGVSKRGFVMDANFDYEVWNHPVFAYKYRYFNPKTKKRVATLAEAQVNRSEWQDPRGDIRAPETATIVGVIMEVSYGVENYPNVNEHQEREATSTEYEYDLELNAKSEIIGGEWYADHHPDFLWVPAKGTFPQSYGDRGEDNVDLNRLDAQAQSYAAMNARQGLPWGPVVRTLVKASKE